MACIGIDLGTTHSLISVFTPDGNIELIPSTDGSVLTPSVVGLLDDDTLVVGTAALARLISNPDKTHAAFKRAIGTEKTYIIGKKSYTPSDLSAFVLRKLKSDLDAIMPGVEIDALVISVPAYFNSTQREATMLAAELAALPQPRLINEPTAAALAYGLHEKGVEQRIVVLDLGGGTFDVSIVEMFEGVMEVRASSGDAMLGGEDFTDVIAADIFASLNLNLTKATNLEKSHVNRAAESIKRHLSRADTAEAQINIGKGEVYTLSRERFEELCETLLIRMRRPIERALYDAKLTVGDIDRVVLVGGATRMPMIRSLVARVFRKLPESGLDPDEVVARGAAVQAALVQNNAALSDMVMTDVAPFTLGIESNIETANGSIPNGFAPILERNTILPASRQSYFSTMQDNQTQIRIAVYQGESPLARDNVKIGETFVTVPPAPKGRESISVRFSYDTSGLLQVEVTTLSTGKVSEMVIEGRASKLTKAEKKERLRALEIYKINPRDNEENTALREKLKELYAMLIGNDRQELVELLAQFERVLDGQDPREIAETRQTLIARVDQIERNYVR